jgi:glycosyltransferase involved in cell wall biosynthesis
VKADVRVIPTGIDIEKMRPGLDGTKIRERYGIADKKVAIHVGRLSPEKCLDVLIKAVAELDEKSNQFLGVEILVSEYIFKPFSGCGNTG